MMKMSPKLSLFLSFFLVFHNSANAFDITQILNQHPDFSTFNTYLTQTNLAADINTRQTITVLVVDNGNTSPLSGLSPTALKNILSVHVVLDYFDAAKIQKLSNTSTIVTTLFQASGLARGQQGFLNITHASTDSISFASAVAGSTSSSSLVKSVASQPYNISVLQVSNVIVPPEATNSSSSNSTTSPPPPPPPPATAPSTSPSKSPSVGSPPPTPAPKLAPPTSSPAPPTSKAPRKAGAPSPAPSSNPAADAPAAADVPAADSPAAKSPVADAPPSNKASDGGKALHVGVSVVLAVVVSAVCLASKV